MCRHPPVHTSGGSTPSFGRDRGYRAPRHTVTDYCNSIAEGNTFPNVVVKYLYLLTSAFTKDINA